MTTPPQQQKFISIGLAGGIGSGKSTVAREICNAVDGQHIDADAIVSKLLQGDALVNTLAGVFGDAICDHLGNLDRAKLGKLVFANEDLRIKLESILHPLVRENIFTEINFLAGELANCTIVLDIPLLFEGGLDKLCDLVVFVDTPDEQRSARACQRHDWSIEHWQAREKMQMPIASKKSLADVIVCNDTSLSALRKQIELLVPRLKNLTPRTLSSRWPQT